MLKKAKWITSPLFAKEKPVNVFGKEKEKIRVSQPERLKNVHTVFYTEIRLDKVSSGTFIDISADDYYFLFINGRFVGMGPAQGYYFSYYFNRFNISSFLHPGINTVEARVYYHGVVCRAYQSADRRMGLIAEIYDENGVISATGGSWLQYRDKRYKKSGTVGYGTLFSENFDYRVKNPAPENAVEIAGDYTFYDEPVKSVSVNNRYPVDTKRIEKGGAVFDFGQELTGMLAFEYVAPKGGNVKIYMGEEEDAGDPTGVKWKMRCSCECSDTVTFDRDSGRYMQSDYRAFRYVSVVPSKGVEIRNIRAVVRHYPFDDSYAVLDSENNMLKRVWEICKNGVKFGSQETFVDCPLREKGQYSGDLTVTGAAHCILTGDPSLLKKAIENEIHSAFICGGLMCVCPGSHMQEIADYSLQLPIHLLRYYKTSGDIAFLERAFPALEKMLDYFKGYSRPDGLIENVSGKWNLVDWPENLRDGYVFRKNAKAPECHNVINAFYTGAHILTDEIREILGKEKSKETEKLIAAFNCEFFDKDKGIYTDCRGSGHYALHSNALPLYFGIAPAAYQNGVSEYIVARGMKCGVYMAYFVLKALCRAGRREDALKLILDDNTWPKMVREGATTCFEAWGKEDKWNTSLCHPWASAPVIVLAEDILPFMPQTGKIIYSKQKP